MSEYSLNRNNDNNEGLPPVSSPSCSNSDVFRAPRSSVEACDSGYTGEGTSSLLNGDSHPTGLPSPALSGSISRARSQASLAATSATHRRSQSLSRLSTSHSFDEPSSLFTRADDTFVPSVVSSGRRKTRFAPIPDPSREILDRLGLAQPRDSQSLASGVRGITSTRRSLDSSRETAPATSSWTSPRPATPISHIPLHLDIPSLPSTPNMDSPASIPRASPVSTSSSIPTTPITPSHRDALLSPLSMYSFPRSDTPEQTRLFSDTPPRSASLRSHSLPRLRAPKISADQRCLESIRAWTNAKETGVGGLLCHIFSSESPEIHSFAKHFFASEHLGRLLDLLWEHARDPFLQWLEPKALDHVEGMMSDEMDALTKAFKMSFADMTPDFLREFSLETTVQPKITKHAPTVNRIVRNALQTTRARKENVKKDPETVCFGWLYDSNLSLANFEHRSRPSSFASSRNSAPRTPTSLQDQCCWRRGLVASHISSSRSTRSSVFRAASDL